MRRVSDRLEANEQRFRLVGGLSARCGRLQYALFYSIDEVSDDKRGHLPFQRKISLVLST